MNTKMSPPFQPPRVEEGLVTERPVLTFADVYREHFDFVFRAAARLGGPTFDAEDAAQEVFIVVGRRLDTFDGSCRITTWLYGITLNVVRAQRRRARIRSLWERAAPPRAPSALESIDRVELRQAHKIAYEVLDKLAPKKREVFILAEFEGLSCDEIAVIVGTRAETVWSRLHYARTEFSARVDKRMRGEQ